MASPDDHNAVLLEGGGEMAARVKYPRTPHVPWSPGAADDDVRATEASGLAGREVVVTEKMDGENTTIYRDGWHARSLSTARHPSRSRVAALAARIGPQVPRGWRICGENLYARHSIAYDDLAGFFLGFAVWNGERCLDWDSTTGYLTGLGIPAVPVLWRGLYNEPLLRRLSGNLNLDRQEGYVVRPAGSFTSAEFPAQVRKWVRPGHVQSDGHWLRRPVILNHLRAVQEPPPAHATRHEEAAQALAAFSNEIGHID